MATKTNIKLSPWAFSVLLLAGGCWLHRGRPHARDPRRRCRRVRRDLPDRRRGPLARDEEGEGEVMSKDPPPRLTEAELTAQSANYRDINGVESMVCEIRELRAAIEASKATFVPAHLTLDMTKVRKFVEEIASLTATVQRESAWVNERNGVIAFLVGALTEVQRSPTIEEARTCAEMARQHIDEWHAGTWLPSPVDDPADWRSRR